MRIGLALAGGGARGVAHLGVLQVLHENKIPIHTIAGSSAGAVAGAMYAATLDPGWMETRFREFLKSDTFKALRSDRIRRSRPRAEPESFFSQISRKVRDKLVITIALTRQGIIPQDAMREVIDYLLPVSDFSDLKIPLKVVVTDLNSGVDVIVTEGDLVEAVVESSSIPGYMWPSKKDGRILMDGGIGCPVPINALLNSGLDFTIAVDIARRKMDSLNRLNVVNLIERAEQITLIRLTDELARKADVVIQPDVAGAHWADFDRMEEFLENGRQATRGVLPILQEKLDKRRRWSYRLRRWFTERAS